MMTFFKWLRVVTATSIFCALSWFYVVIDKDAPNLHVLAQIQFIQAALAGIMGIVVVWLIASSVFGRIYCSAICPFGVMQDVFSRIAKLVRGKKRKFQFRPAMTKTRLILLGLFLLGLLHLYPLFVTILDPYSNYGCIVSATARPVYRKANDMLAKREHAKKNYNTAFRIVDENARRVQSPELITALVALGIIGVLATLYGRRYCNTICPVGTILGLASRHSRFRVRLKQDCTSCGVCAAACKGECIDAKSKTVDASRCVACFNCLSTCKRDAIVYSSPLREEVKGKKQGGIQTNTPRNTEEQKTPVTRHALPAANPRRHFMHWSVFSLLVPAIAGILVKKSKVVTASTTPGSTQGEGHVPYQKTLPVIPPGAHTVKRYKSKCTGCHLCVSKCPAGVITPSTFELG
ncbi:MAG: 4Fe-4S binding protein, partial [Planctomycetaceae bacterium]|nr:4Fe-4S binding protein [Planctomycetaceae bacterium]